MTDLTERVAALERGEEDVGRQLEEIRRDVRDIRRLTVAVERIALRLEDTARKVDDIDARLDDSEDEPAENARYLRRTVIGCAVSTAAGFILSQLLGILFG